MLKEKLQKLLENTCMQKPSPCWQNHCIFEHEVSRAVVMVTQKFFKNILTNLLKISLLITKLSISQHIYVRYVIIRNIGFNLR
jgi:hypothetical protein